MEIGDPLPTPPYSQRTFPVLFPQNKISLSVQIDCFLSQLPIEEQPEPPSDAKGLDKVLKLFFDEIDICLLCRPCSPVLLLLRQ